MGGASLPFGGDDGSMIEYLKELMMRRTQQSPMNERGMPQGMPQMGRPQRPIPTPMLGQMQKSFPPLMDKYRR